MPCAGIQGSVGDTYNLLLSMSRFAHWKWAPAPKHKARKQVGIFVFHIFWKNTFHTHCVDDTVYLKCWNKQVSSTHYLKYLQISSRFVPQKEVCLLSYITTWYDFIGWWQPLLNLFYILSRAGSKQDTLKFIHRCADVEHIIHRPEYSWEEEGVTSSTTVCWAEHSIAFLWIKKASFSS